MAEKNQKQDKKQELSWHITVAKMPHKDGFSYPVFTWSYGAKDGLRGGELRAWPLQGILVFDPYRGEGPFKYEILEKAMAKIDEYGWGKPPHIDEVFAELQNIQKNFPKSIIEAKNFFGEDGVLDKKWKKLVA